MRKIVDLLRLQAEGLSVRQVADSLGLPRSTVADYIRRLKQAGLTWPLPAEADEAELLEGLFGAVCAGAGARPLPEWGAVLA